MKYNFLFIFLSLFLFSCSSKRENQLVLISTEYGNIKIRLYDDTPLHRDNFAKLAKKGFFDDLLFHQVNKNYIIQGGNPASKDAAQNRLISSEEGIGYTLASEIVYPKHFNKRGAIGAVREDDDVNPNKESSGSEFYIVLGNIYTNEQLDEIEKTDKEKRLNAIIESLFIKNQDSIQKIMKNNPNQLEVFQNKLIEQASIIYKKTTELKFTAEQRKAYTTIGGVPQLDNNYTVFGEVIEGFDVLDKIAQVKVGFANRPMQDIKMKVKLIK